MLMYAGRIQNWLACDQTLLIFVIFVQILLDKTFEVSWPNLANDGKE